MEFWRGVVGFEGDYEVSSMGRVRSLDGIVKNPATPGGVRRRPGKYLTPSALKSGHLYVTVAGAKRLVHRLVLEAFCGRCPDGYETRHLDGNPANNNIGNICWGTRLENAQDKIRLGEQPRGSSHGHAKLNEEKVRSIRILYKKTDAEQKDLADLFGVSSTTISEIVNNKLWTHVGDA